MKCITEVKWVTYRIFWIKAYYFLKVSDQLCTDLNFYHKLSWLETVYMWAKTWQKLFFSRDRKIMKGRMELINRCFIGMYCLRWRWGVFLSRDEVYICNVLSRLFLDPVLSKQDPAKKSDGRKNVQASPKCNHKQEQSSGGVL